MDFVREVNSKAVDITIVRNICVIENIPLFYIIPFSVNIPCVSFDNRCFSKSVLLM